MIPLVVIFIEKQQDSGCLNADVEEGQWDA